MVQFRNFVTVVKGIDPVVAGQTDLCLEKRPAESEGACSAFSALTLVVQRASAMWQHATQADSSLKR